jgi:hypothetical protein
MSHLLRRCLVGLVAGVGVVATSVAVPAAAAAAPTVQTAWARYDFRSAHSGYLAIKGRVDPGPGAFFATTTVFNAHSSQPQAPFSFVLDLDSSAETGTYGAVGNRDLCPGAVTCVFKNGGLVFDASFDVTGDGRHVQDIRSYIAARGTHVVIRDMVLRHWEATHRASGVVRRTVADVDGAGVVAAGQVVGSNVGVTAPGPAGGSIAIAVPGCDQIGAGALILSGGATGETTLCPTGPIAAVAKRSTTWTATGAVAGWSEYTTRLIVLRA